MSNSDIIGSIGVMLMLIAFVLNIVDVLNNDHPFYIISNLIGGVLSCIAAIMISYLPFVILEGAWSIASAWALYIYFTRDFRKNKNG